MRVYPFSTPDGTVMMRMVPTASEPQLVSDTAHIHD
jgi:hypothetical protein